MEITSMLDKSYGFSSGNLNTGNAGDGWGINTSTYFQTVKNKTYELNHTGGLVVDLYSLVFMNPMEKLDFLVDISEIDQDYIKVIQEQNLLYFIPNFDAIVEDNYVSNKFKLNIEIIGTNGSNDNIDMFIDYIQDSKSGSKSYEIIYNNMDFKIPLSTLLMNSFDYSQTELETIEIRFINNIPYSDYSITNLITNGCLDTTKIAGILNPVIDFRFNINNNIYDGIIKFMNFNDTIIPETIISNLQSYITPVNGDFIDVKKYVNGDSYNLVIKPAGSLSIATNTFKIDSCGHYISIIPNTVEMFKYSVVHTFVQKFVFETDRSRGVFDLYITIDPKALSNTPTMLNNLIPKINPQTFTVSNNILHLPSPGINLEPLLGNRIFDPLNPVKIEFSNGGNNIQSLNISNVNGPHLFQSGSNNEIPDYVKLNFTYNNILVSNANPKIIIFKEDKVLYREAFEVAPLTFHVFKNSASTLNVLDYIKVPKTELKNIIIESADQNYFKTIFGTDIITINPTLFSATKTFKGPETRSIETFITVKNTSTYKDPYTKDDYGNIIGHRQIPVTIEFNDAFNNTNTDINLICDPIKVVFLGNNPTNVLDFNLKDIIKNIDLVNLMTDKTTKFLNVTIDPTTNIDIGIFYKSGITGKKFNIGWEETTLGIFGYFNTLSFQNSRVVINFDFLNSAGETKTYSQIINFVDL